VRKLPRFLARQILLNSSSRSRHRTLARQQRRAAVTRRALKFEPLEDRRLLAVDISDFSTLSGSATPNSIVSGPDGNLWYTESATNAIATMNLGGTALAEYPIPTSNSFPGGIAVGLDHNLWFTEGKGKIGRFDPTAAAGSQFTEFPLSPTITGGGTPTAIAAGPDGNLWFVDQRNNAIGKITTSGAITEYTIPTSSSTPYSIAAGPDGNLWFTELFGNKIGRITPAGAITEFPLGGFDQPEGITAGPDGAMWFTEQNANTIARITPGGAISEYPLFTGIVQPTGIALGSDGKIYFTESGVSRIGQLDPANPETAPAEFAVPTSLSAPSAIAPGSDGNVWFTEYNGSRIGRVNVPFSPNPPTNIGVDVQATPAPVKVGNQITYTIAVKNFGGQAAQNVVVYNPIPALANFSVDNGDSISSSQGDVTVSPGNLLGNPVTAEMIAKLGTLNAGATATITLKVHVTGDGDLAENANVVSDSPDTFLDNNSFTLHTTAQPRITSLALGGLMIGDVTGNPMTYDVGTNTGNTGKFQFQLTNTGGDAPTNVVVSMTLPAPLTNVAAYPPSVFSYDAGTRKLTFAWTSMASGEKKVFGFTAQATAVGPISVPVSVAASEQIAGGPLFKTVMTTVGPVKASAALKGALVDLTGKPTTTPMTIDADTGSVTTAGIYGWKLQNTGAATMTHPSVTIPVPTQLTGIVPRAFIGSLLNSVGNATYDSASHLITITSLPDLAAGQTLNFGFVTNPTSIGPVTVTAKVNIDQPLVGGGSLTSTVSTVVLSSLHNQLYNPDPSLGPDAPEGPVIPNADLYPIFYGSQWQVQADGVTPAPADVLAFPGNMATAMKSIVSGPYMDFLSQYSTSTTTIGRGTTESRTVILAPPPAAPTQQVLDDHGANSQIKGIIKGQIQNIINSTGSLPDPKNAVFVLFTPPGADVSEGSLDSANGILGFHNSLAYTYNSSTYTYNYVVMPYHGGTNAINTGATQFQSMTKSLSHEIAEVVTDPDVVTGWRDYVSPNRPEIGDIESPKKLQTEPEGGTHSWGTLDGVVVQYEWANYYQYPGTNLAVVDQPVLPRDPAAKPLGITTIYYPLNLAPTGGAAGESSGYSYSGLIAAFQDLSNPGNDPAIYTPTIDWGDGTTSTGTVAYDANLKQFLISGLHTFTAAAGSTATIYVSLVDNANGDSAGFAADVVLEQATAPPAQVGFDQPAFEAYRNGADAAITVDRVGDTTFGATVDFHVSGGTAVDGTDYQSESGTLQFPPGASSATILLPVYANPAAASDLTVNLVLSTATGNTALGAQTSTVLTIHPSSDIFAPAPPTLEPHHDTGVKVNDGITYDNGSSAAPLVLNITGASVPNGFVQLVDVTDPANPFTVGDPVQATGGQATITIQSGALADGIHQLAVSSLAAIGTTMSHASSPIQVTVDTASPTSQVAALAARTSVTSLPVSWSGADNASGSGIAAYNISVSVDGAAATPWLIGTKLTSSTYAAALGHTYAFLAQAADVAGNTEPVHVTADTSARVTATPWQNERHPLDVSNDGSIAPNDALIVINRINSAGSGPLPANAAAADFYVDVSGDGSIAPNDALFVINAINAGQGGAVQGEGEGDAPHLPSAADVVTAPAGMMPDETLSDLIALLAQDAAQTAQNRKQAAAAAARQHS